MPTRVADYAKTKTCSGDCGKAKPLASFPEDKRRADGRSPICAGCRFEAASDEQRARLLAETKDEDLATVEMKAVEILAEGGPYHGSGSPEEGDFFSEDDLDAIAAANKALEKEVRAPNKIGHNSKQKLLRNSGLAEDEQPAAGWLKNFRVVKEEKGAAKLVADISKVPKKLAGLLRAGAFRTRSVELSRITKQSEPDKGKKYDAVITGLAWLGAKAPAVRTLDDIIAWYAAREGIDDPETAADLLLSDADEAPQAIVVYAADPDAIEAEVVRLVDFATGGTVWDSDEGLGALRSKVEAALNPGPGEWRYWVRDVQPGKALVSTNGMGDTEVWVVPFTLNDDGAAQLADLSEWTLAKQEWVAASSDEYASDRVEALTETEIDGSADTSSSTMPETKTKTPPKPAELSDEQVAAFATALEIEETDDAKRREAVLAKMAEYAPPGESTEGDGGDGNDGGDGGSGGDSTETPAATTAAPETALSSAEAEVLKAKAEKGERAYEERRVEKRDAAISSALEDGRIDPAKREFWASAIDDDEERALTLLSEMPVNDEYKKVFGKDEDGLDAGSRESAETAQYRAYLDQVGADPDDSIVLHNAERSAA